MLRGFNPWQVRIAALGSTGILLGIIGAWGWWPTIIVVGSGLSLLSILVLILLGNRQNWQQSRRLQSEINNLTRNQASTESRSRSSQTTASRRIGATFEYANRVKENVSYYESFALRSKSLEIRDAFALAATDHEFNYEALTRFVAVQRMGILPGVKRSDLKNWAPEIFLAIARLQANQQATEADLENATLMFAFAHTFFGKRTFSRKDRLIYLEALGELGRYEQQAALAKHFQLTKYYPLHSSLIRLNAIQAEHGAISSAWLEELNALYVDNRYSAVHLKDSLSAKPLDRLESKIDPIDNGPLVSVIIPTYQGGPHLLTAVKSLLHQSWQNLEILIVDDGSGPAYRVFLEEASKLSPKVRVLRQENNLGAYSARNAGVVEAHGDYITVHDDDDWSHGDKIAAQVRHLIDNPAVPGNMSSLVRVTDNLKCIRINANPTLLQTNYSSLMVRRETFDEIGRWDPVNRGADSEFRDRIVKHYRTKVHVIDEVPLSFTRTWEGSLTSGELKRGFVDPARILYSKAYKNWHEKAANQPNLLKPAEPRRFPAPSNMLPGQRNIDHGQLDITYMADFSDESYSTTAALKYMKAYSDAGYNVGFIHTESPLSDPTSGVAEQLFSMQLQKTVVQVGLQDAAEIATLIVSDPTVLTFMDETKSNLLIKKAVLVVDIPPVRQDGQGMIFDLPSCLKNLDRLSLDQAVVLAEDNEIRVTCENLVPKQRLVDTWQSESVGIVPKTASDRRDRDRN